MRGEDAKKKEKGKEKRGIKGNEVKEKDKEKITDKSL